MRIALFLTRGMSLTKWKKIGTLDREIKPYLELAKEHDVTIFTYGNDKQIKGLTILPVWKSLFMHFDYIKTNQMDGALVAVLNKWINGGKLIVRCGYEWLRFLENNNAPLWKRLIANWIEKVVYSNADDIVITSVTEAVFIIQRFDRAPSIIPNYVDTERFKPLDIPKIKNRALFIGRKSKEKNLDAVKKYAKDHGLKLACIHGGVPQSKLPVEYNKSEYYIQLSTTEGCSKTLLEAMACGLKCITSDIPTNREITNNENSGERNREIILNRFSFNKIMEKEKKLYER